jgi:hypothetical protein
MRRGLLVSAGLAVLVAGVLIWRTRHEAPGPTSVEEAVPAPAPARIVSSTPPPLPTPEGTPRTAAPVAPEREPTATNEERSVALHQALATTTPEAARLYADLAKAGVATPAEARTLVEMKQGGAAHDELVAYVRSSFPKDMITRAVALRWLDAGSATRPSPTSSPSRSLGTLVKRDAN